MGLHSPFHYVDYEGPMAELLIAVLSKLCATCHTDGDYEGGCRGCPAGQLVFECREYILTAHMEDAHHALHVSEKWLQKRRERGCREQTEEERAQELQFVEDYRPECDVLRLMQRKARYLVPRPYTRSKGRGDVRRAERLASFAALCGQYSELRKARLLKWGL